MTAAKLKAKETANQLTRHCLAVLSSSGFNVWRQNNAAVYDAKKQIYRSNSSTKGIPDIIGYHRKTAVFIGVEIKAGKDRISVEQKQFIHELDKSGGWNFIIRSNDDIVLMADIFKRPQLITNDNTTK